MSRSCSGKYCLELEAADELAPTGEKSALKLAPAAIDGLMDLWA